MTALDGSKLLIAGFHVPYHGARSGYDQLQAFLPGTYLDAGTLPFGRSAHGSFARKLNMSLFEAHLARVGSRYDLIHYLYPEDHLSFSMLRAKRGKRVATFHLPFAWFAELERTRSFNARLRLRAYRQLDGIIALCREDEARLGQAFPDALVRFIPHGVHGAPRPAGARSDGVDIVTAGSHYRDLHTYRETVRQCARDHPDWRFHLVGALPEWQREFASHDRVTVHEHLDDARYFALLEGCRVSFLPLTHATANNAMLEAHAHGVPTVVTDLPGARDYAVETTAFFRSAETAVAELERMVVRPEDERVSLAQDTYRHASRFGWEDAATRTREFYEAVLSR